MYIIPKRITRKTANTVRDRGKRRELVITLYPNGTIGLRPVRTRQEETVTIEAIYDLAVKQRVAQKRAERRKKR